MDSSISLEDRIWFLRLCRHNPFSLYLLFTSDFPQAPNFTVGTFADDTVILNCHTDVLRASSCLQEYLNILQRWLHMWNIKINEFKSTHLTFTLRRDASSPIYLSNVAIPPATTVKYLGLHLDNKLNWKEHIIKKWKQMDLRHKAIYSLLGTSSRVSVGNKLLLYKCLITPKWTYDFELWDSACKSNTPIVQKCQSKILRAIVHAPWYVNNAIIHENQGIPTVQEVIHVTSTKHRIKLATHSNHLPHPIPRDNFVRRLKWRWPADLQFGERDLAVGDLITLVRPQVWVIASL